MLDQSLRLLFFLNTPGHHQAIRSFICNLLRHNTQPFQQSSLYTSPEKVKMSEKVEQDGTASPAEGGEEEEEEHPQQDENKVSSPPRGDDDPDDADVKEEHVADDDKSIPMEEEEEGDEVEPYGSAAEEEEEEQHVVAKEECEATGDGGAAAADESAAAVMNAEGDEEDEGTSEHHQLPPPAAGDGEHAPGGAGDDDLIKDKENRLHPAAPDPRAAADNTTSKRYAGGRQYFDDKDDEEEEDVSAAIERRPDVIAQNEYIAGAAATTELEKAMKDALDRKDAHIRRLQNEIDKMRAFVSKRKQTYKRKRKDEGAPIRALSAYNIFIKERFAELARQNEDALKSADSGAVMKRVPPANLVTKTGNEWKDLSPEIKAKYEERYVRF